LICVVILESSLLQLRIREDTWTSTRLLLERDFLIFFASYIAIGRLDLIGKCLNLIRWLEIHSTTTKPKNGEEVKVSVIICTLNKKHILPEVVPCIKRSPLVDDVIIIEGLKPIGYARDIGWRKARNPFICFVDDDEIIPPGWIERLAREFNDSRVGAVSSIFEPLNKNLINMLECIVQNHSLKRYGLHARFVRKRALEEIGGFEHTIGGETVYAAVKMAQHGWKTKIIDYPYYHKMFDNCYSWILNLYRTGKARAPEILARGDLLQSYKTASGSFVRGFQLSLLYRQPMLLLFYPMRSWLHFLGIMGGIGKQ